MSEPHGWHLTAPARIRTQCRRTVTQSVAAEGLCRDRAALRCNRLKSNGVGGHLLIPQGTACHLLSSPYCTQILAGLLNFSHSFQHNFREPSRPATSERDVLL